MSSRPGVTGGDRISVVGAVAAAVAVGLAGSCARTGAPPGGDLDFYPPVVIRTTPDTFETLEAFDGPLVIEFSERISERTVSGTLDDAVLISPALGEVGVSHGRSSLEVRMSGGFRAGLVYRVTVLPTVRDMFNNPLLAPFEWVFSTGPDFHAGVVAGMVIDRITGEPVEGAAVQMSDAGLDSTDVVFVARTDTSGIFALRYVPTGQYMVRAFEDRNRNQEADDFEAQGQLLRLLGVNDTLLFDLVVLTPDTSAAVLAQVALVDSMTLGLTFDDHLDPQLLLANVTVGLVPVPDTTEEGVSVPPAGPGVDRILHDQDFQTHQDSVREAQALARAAEAEAAARDSTAGDPGTPVIAPTARDPGGRIPGPGANLLRPPGQEQSVLPEGVPLPSQQLFVLLEAPLPAGHSYRVVVTSVTNINDVPGGGGERPIRREPPPEVADTAAVAPDTTGVARDTLGVARDTVGVAGDTLGIRPAEQSRR